MSDFFRLCHWIPGHVRDFGWRPAWQNDQPMTLASMIDPSGVFIDEELAFGAWSKIVEKVQRLYTIDLRTSDDVHIWEALEDVASVIEPDFPIPIASSQWLVLFEGRPTLGYLVNSRAAKAGDIPSAIPDVCLVPWPRCNWLIMQPHEDDIDPLFLSLK